MTASKVVRAIAALLALYVVNSQIVYGQRRSDCIGITIEPDKCSYAMEDTVLITITNRCPDTLFVTPQLFSFGTRGWEPIVDDLESYWQYLGPERGVYETANLQPILPQGTRQVHVNVADIAADFRRKLIFRFAARGVVRHQRKSINFDQFWSGPQFMLTEPTEREDSLLNMLQERRYTRDSIFASYDPLTNTPVIPLDVIKRRPYRLILPDPFDTAAIPAREKTRCEITWPAPSTDGSLELVITKRQIWLRSNHENPNPNELFWVTDIDKGDFAAIEQALAKRRRDFDEVMPNGFSRYLYWKKFTPEAPLPSEWTDSTGQIVIKDFREKRYLNAKKLIDIINEALPANRKVQFPSREKLDQIRSVQWESAL